MRCQHCGYEGPRSEFKRDMDPVYTSASPGMRVRACPRCNQNSFFSRMDERDEDEEELKVLCLQIQDAINAGELKEVPHLRRKMIELNEGLDMEWVGKFVRFIDSKMRKSQG